MPFALQLTINSEFDTWLSIEGVLLFRVLVSSKCRLRIAVNFPQPGASVKLCVRRVLARFEIGQGARGLHSRADGTPGVTGVRSETAPTEAGREI